MYFLLQEGHHDDQEHNLYSRFRVSGRDIAALFTVGISLSQTCDLQTAGHSSRPSAYPITGCHSYSLIDRCGIIVIAEQVQLSQSHSFFSIYWCSIRLYGTVL